MIKHINIRYLRFTQNVGQKIMSNSRQLYKAIGPYFDTEKKKLLLNKKKNWLYRALEP